MWSDNETVRDLVNFSHVADIAAERIVGAKGEPLSVGISGDWGVGKSSMMKLLRTSLSNHKDVEFRFVEFNAWLYQNYDDARAALMEAIATAVVEQAVAKKDSLSETALKHARSLLGRVKKLRLLGLVGSTAIDIYAGGHLTPFLAAGMGTVGGLLDGDVTSNDLKKAQKLATDTYAGGKKLVGDKTPEEAPKPDEADSPRKAIQAFRDDLETTLAALGVTLVVLIDDLDRCLPKTAIATLESMRLFLFLKHTAFVIAADEGMIRQAVRSHFENATLDDDLVTNYFDKLIQLPIRVPALGTQEVRAYLMMLFVDADPDLDGTVRDSVREAVCKRLAQSWTGARVDKAFVAETIRNCAQQTECAPSMLNRLALAERIAPILTTSPKIRGNPRLIKRFLNTLSMRSSMARIQSVTVDEEVLVKLLLFERCGEKDAYGELLRAVNESDEGHPEFLRDMERRARGDDSAPELEKPWNEAFHMNWLSMDPPLSDKDLRGALYVGRESHPIISRADELSSDAIEVLDMLLRLNSASPIVGAEIAKLSIPEVSRIVDKVLVRARNETAWGTPQVLNALQALAAASPPSARTIVAFFSDLPSSQIKASIVPRLATLNWGQEVLTAFHKRGDMAGPTKNAIAKSMKGKS